MIPDSHAHLDLINREAEEVVASARAIGVAPIITIGISLASSLEAVRTAGVLDGVYAAVGIHPNDSQGASKEDFDALEEVAVSSDRVVAIGETGLDYYRERASRESQQLAFRKHIKLAKRLGKPIIVHDRQAHEDVLQTLADEGAADTGVIMHCFSGDADVLRECTARGYFISFAGPVTFKKSDGLRKAASLAPLDHLLAETDSPFLSPEPFRGKPNLPERVRFVAETLAGVRSVSAEEMENILTSNTERAFRINLKKDGK